MKAFWLVIFLVACGSDSDSEPAATPVKQTAPATALQCNAESCEILVKLEEVTCSGGFTYVFYDPNWKNKYSGTGKQEMIGKTVQIFLTNPTPFDDASITEYRLEYECE